MRGRFNDSLILWWSSWTRVLLGERFGDFAAFATSGQCRDCEGLETEKSAPTGFSQGSGITCQRLIGERRRMSVLSRPL